MAKISMNVPSVKIKNMPKVKLKSTRKTVSTKNMRNRFNSYSKRIRRTLTRKRF